MSSSHRNGCQTLLVGIAHSLLIILKGGHLKFARATWRLWSDQPHDFVLRGPVYTFESPAGLWERAEHEPDHALTLPRACAHYFDS
ncbi:hypothetical protein VNO77_03822 [Canavalia gladiata]|uniref:Uncharacterized protein n=1 Tax=Canavalia gladiata TaxID=3824 RepID=A0AAN9MW90_CANGL